MSSSSGNDNGLGRETTNEKLGNINVLGMSRNISQDHHSALLSTSATSTAPSGSAPLTPRPTRVDLPIDELHDTSGRAYTGAHREESHSNSRPFVNPLVHKSSFGHQAGIDLGPKALTSLSRQDSASRRILEVEVLKMEKDVSAPVEASAGSLDAPFSPISQPSGHQPSLQPSSTFAQLPLHQPSEDNDRRENGRVSNEEDVRLSLQESRQEHATPQKKLLPTKSPARNGNTAAQISAMSSPATARAANITANPLAVRSAGSSSMKPSRSSNHRLGPQLPCAPNVVPAPPPAMYWSKVPVHGSVPRRSFRAHTANLADEVMWLFGGCDAKGCFRELWCFDTETMCWSKPKVTGDLPPPRRAHSATMVDKRLFVFAGGDGPHYFNDLYVFDTVSLCWTKPDVYGQPPSPRRAHTSNYHNGQLIIFGGGNGVGALNDVFSLDINDPSRLEWKKIDCKGKIPIGRGYHTSNLVDGKLIVIGGSDGHMSFNDIHVLRLDTKVWYQVKTDEIHNRLGHTATQVGSYLFIVGGHDSHAYTPEILTLNLVNLQWEPRRVSGQKPPGRGYHQAWLRDSRLFVHGGFDGKEIYDDLHYVDLAACAYLPQITSFSVELDDD